MFFKFLILSGRHTLMTVILAILIQSNDVLAKQAQPSLVVAINHYPPWIDTSVEPFAGIDTEFIRQLASELSATISFVACPLKRCLVLMEQGRSGYDDRLI